MNKLLTRFIVSPLLFICCTFSPLPSNSSLAMDSTIDWKEMKIETRLNPLYSFTNEISYHETSKNGQKIVIRSTGLQSGNTYIHVASADGTNLIEVFSPGTYKIGDQWISLTAEDQYPSISGDGRYVCMGVHSNETTATKKTDYVFVFDSLTQKMDIFSLRILVPGTNQTVFAPALHKVPNIDIDASGELITAQVEIGYFTSSESWIQTAIFIMNRNGSNQKVIVGPKEFSRTKKSFIFDSHVHSPHMPRFSSHNRIVFFAQLFENQSPYEQKGELYSFDLQTGFLNQLTSSRRFDPKPEEQGPFILNMYGTKIFFKMMVHGVSTLTLIATDGSGLTHIVPLEKESPFCISGDGNKIFYLDQQNQGSLVSISFLTNEKYFIIDKTSSGEPLRNFIYHSLDSSSFPRISCTNFTGSTLFYTVSTHSLVRLDTLQQTASSRKVNAVFEKDRSVIFVNKQPVSVFTSPYIQSNRIMIPLSIITKYYGMQYFPNLTRGILQITYNSNYYTFYTGSSTFIQNGVEKTLPQPIDISHNEPFIPGGSMPSVFSFQIQWDAKTYSLQVIR